MDPRRVKESYRDAFFSTPGVVGLGVWDRCLVAYVERPNVRLPEVDFPCASWVTGPVHLGSAQMYALRYRPYAGGVSVGTYSNRLRSYISGTLGMVVFDGNGPQLLGNNHIFCYHPNTEVLTASGFRNIAEVTVGDYVATRSPEGMIEHKAVEQIFCRPWDGKLLYFQGRFYNLTVTPDHNMFVLAESKGRGHFRKWKSRPIQAEELVSHSAYDSGGRSGRLGYAYHFSTTGSWDGKTEKISIPKVEYLRGPDFNKGPMQSDLLAYFLGWWLGDGSLARNNGNYVTTIRAVRPSELLTAKTILAKLGFNATIVPEYGYLQVASKQLYEFLAPLKHEGKGQKEFPRFILDYSRETVQSLIMGYLRADGCYTNKGCATATTISQSLAYGFQEAIFKAGMTGSMRMIKGAADGWSKGGEYYALSFHKAPHERLRIWKPEQVHYKGDVYCISVPNHVILVRGSKESLPIWCGNCGLDTFEHPTTEAGQPIWQPGTYFGGSPSDVIATLTRWVPVYEDEPNLVDCALATPVEPYEASPDILGLGAPSFIADPYRGMPVTKAGMMTGLTSSYVTDVDATIRVSYGPVTATLEDQIIIANPGYSFAKPGDSGSVVVGPGLEAVGLLSGGSESIVVANRMRTVQRALNFRLR